MQQQPAQMRPSLFDVLARPSRQPLFPVHFHGPLQQYALTALDIERILTPEESETWASGILLRYLHRRFGSDANRLSAEPILLSPALMDWLKAPASGHFARPLTNLLRLIGLYMAPFDRVYNLKTQRGVKAFYLEVMTKYALAMNLPPELYSQDIFDYVNQDIYVRDNVQGGSYPLSRAMAHVWRYYVTNVTFEPTNAVRRADFMLQFFSLVDLAQLDMRLVTQGMCGYLCAPLFQAGLPGVAVTGLMREIFRIAGLADDDARWGDPAFCLAMIKSFFEGSYATLVLPAEVVEAHQAIAGRLGLSGVKPKSTLGTDLTLVDHKYVMRPPAPLPIDAREAIVNVIDWDEPHAPFNQGTHGLIQALEGAGIPLSYTMPHNSPWQQRRQAYARFRAKPLAPINLFACRLECLADFMLGHGLEKFEGRYNIAYAAWETDQLPEACLIALDLLDEIWVASTFEKELFERATNKPVFVMPQAVEAIEPSPVITRTTLELDESAFYFLTVFDCFDWLSRKNPVAVINAFQKAFPERRDVGLIIKTRYIEKGLSSKEEGAIRRLQRRAALDDRIIFMHHDYNDAEMAGLISLADAYITLHRCSAFGRTAAEAMALGRPVISTAWSGTADFVQKDTALPIDYKLCDVVFDGYTFLDKEVGHGWADPDLDSAAAAMRKLVDNRAFATALGLEGQKKIKANYNRAACSARLRARLQDIINSFKLESAA